MYGFINGKRCIIPSALRFLVSGAWWRLVARNGRRRSHGRLGLIGSEPPPGWGSAGPRGVGGEAERVRERAPWRRLEPPARFFAVWRCLCGSSAGAGPCVSCALSSVGLWVCGISPSWRDGS